MTHVTDEVRKAVQDRIRAGVAWLDKNAPLLWRNNMHGIRNYKAIFRAKNQYTEEGVLALAFEGREDLASKGGYVTLVTVADAFDLSQQDLRNLGFDVDEHAGITTQLLNEEWREYLRADVESIPLSPMRHQRNVMRA